MQAAEVVNKIEDIKVAVTTIGPDLTEAISNRIEAVAVEEEAEAEAIKAVVATEVAVETVAVVIVAEVREEVSPINLCHRVCCQVNQFHLS